MLVFPFKIIKNLIIGFILVFSQLVTADYAQELATAKVLAKGEKFDEAIKAFVELAEKTDIRDRNAECLREAALIANGQKNYEKALELAKKIRNKPLSKTCRMEIMLRNKKYQELIDEFKDEDIALWPEHCVGKGFYSRGCAYQRLKKPEEAAADLEMATLYYASKSEMSSALLDLGNTYLNGLKDEAKALKAFKKLATDGLKYAWTTRAGIRNAVVLYIKQKNYSDAHRILDKYDVSDLTGGYWSGIILLSRARIFAAEGRRDEAIALYKTILGMADIPKGMVKESKSEIAPLEKEIAEEAAALQEKR